MNYFLLLALALFFYMTLWFVISIISKKNDVADVAWGLGFIFLSWLSFVKVGNANPIAFLISSVVSIWGFRLSWHIYKRNKNKSEDYRYLAWRKSWGRWFYLRSYFQVYLLQGCFLFIIASSVLVINNSPNLRMDIFTVLGLLLWAFGFAFEAISDWQLARFINHPENKGKLMMSGLWAYTRHPNYFGEVAQWWGIWLVTIQTDQAFIALLSPVTITLLLLRVSGIPLLEKRMTAHPDFAAYKRRVSMFFPLPPKKLRDKHGIKH